MMKLMLVSSVEVCERCGREIKKSKVKILGIEKEFKIMCECIKKEFENQRIKENERKEIEKLSRLFRQSRLGNRFKNSKFENIVINNNNKNIITSLKHFAENFNDNSEKSFLLYSHPGTGKTLITSAVVNYLVSKGISAIFITVPDLLTQIRESYSYGNETEAQILRGLTDCKLLVLDDMGAEKSREGDWASEKMFQIINSRYNNLKSTIFTTNCNSKELQDKLGKRTFSRICEMTGKENRFNLENEKDWRIEK